MGNPERQGPSQSGDGADSEDEKTATSPAKGEDRSPQGPAESRPGDNPGRVPPQEDRTPSTGGTA